MVLIKIKHTPLPLEKDWSKYSRSKSPLGINGLMMPRKIQSNPDGSNTDGSFTIVDSNSFFSPYEILPIAQKNKYFVCVEVLRPSQSNGVMSSAVSLPSHTFTGQA